MKTPEQSRTSFFVALQKVGDIIRRETVVSIQWMVFDYVGEVATNDRC